MSIDMKQFHAVFLTSQEHLDEMEHLLLELNTENPDAENNSLLHFSRSSFGKGWQEYLGSMR